MKKITVFLWLLVLSTNVLAQSEETFTLTLTFEITEHGKGQILLAMYDSAENHMGEPYKSAVSKVENGKTNIKMENLESGYYSFSYFHDLDSNTELKTNFVGIPKEPYGFSNNAKARLGPPSFEDCKIKIDKDTIIQISIK